MNHRDSSEVVHPGTITTAPFKETLLIAVASSCLGHIGAPRWFNAHQLQMDAPIALAAASATAWAASSVDTTFTIVVTPPSLGVTGVSGVASAAVVDSINREGLVVVLLLDVEELYR